MSVRSLVAAATVAALSVLALPGAASATEATAVQPGASLRLTIIPDEEGGLDGLDQIVSVTLECEPDGGEHPDPAYACAALRDVDGVFENLPPASGGCLGVWEPVTIVATGTWFGRDVTFLDRHSNAGCAALATNLVFAF